MTGTDPHWRRRGRGLSGRSGAAASLARRPVEHICWLPCQMLQAVQQGSDLSLNREHTSFGVPSGQRHRKLANLDREALSSLDGIRHRWRGS